jgi:hypothetical protein
MQLHEVVDLERYPIDDPQSERFRDLVARCQAGLADVGASVMEGFVRPEAIQRIVDQVSPREHLAFRKVKHHNVYLEADDPSFPDDHPRNAKETTTSATLGNDHLTDVTELATLYGSEHFKAFVATSLGHSVLYPYEDEVSGINILYYPTGTSLGWHFDNSTFTTTLMVREAEAGAAFEFVPFLRSDTDRAYESIAALRAGDRSLVKALHQTDGTLVLFKGSRTVHRVTPVIGDTTRLLATMTFSPEPGARLSAVNQMTFYGRSAALQGAETPHE